MKIWHVVHTKPQKEALLCEQLSLRRIETYYPCMRVKPINPRAHKIKPYFPGYLFICVDLVREITSSLRWMPGAMDLVCFGDEPAVVPDELIQKIKLKVDSINHVPIELCDGWNEGFQLLFEKDHSMGMTLSLMRIVW